MKLLSAYGAASLSKACIPALSSLRSSYRRVVSLTRMASSNQFGPSASSLEGMEAPTARLTASIDGPHPWQEAFDITEDRPMYTRYMTVYDRLVTFTPDSGESHSVRYDVVGHPHCGFCFAVALPFHLATESTPAQVTVIREYAQGPNTLMYCFPSGGFDKRKHANLRECAQAEMAEEAMLVGGEVVPLLPEDHPGQSELKWSCNSFKPFLIIEPEPAPKGHTAARDAEEHTIEVMRVTIPELRKLIGGGQLMLPSVYAFFLAQDVLQERRLI